MDSESYVPSSFGGRARAVRWIVFASAIAVLFQIWQAEAERPRMGPPGPLPSIQRTTFSRTFALDPKAAFPFASGRPVLETKAWQPVTSIFLHPSLVAFLLSALALLRIAPEVERTLGTGKFLGLFLLCAAGGAIAQGISSSLGVVPPAARAFPRAFGCLGALSGALFAFGILFPEGLWLSGPVLPFRRIFVYGAAWFAAYVSAYFAMGRDPAVMTTLVGMPIAWVYIRADDWMSRLLLRISIRIQEREFEEEQGLRLRLDGLLDKLRRHGMDSLTRKEKAFLQFASRRLNNSRQP